jgi:hypothetical protein
MPAAPLRLFSDRAGSTLAGSINNTQTTMNLTAGGGALFPNPSSPNFFAATFIDAATGLLEEIVWCTARSTDTLTIIRGQEGSTAQSWNAGDLFQKLVTSGDMESFLQSNQLVAGASTFYVNWSTGNDSWNGLSSTFVSGVTGPFKTHQGAINVISLLLSTSTITILTADNINYPTFFIPSSFVSVWNIIGNTTTPANVVITNPSTATNNGNAIGTAPGVTATVAGMTLVSPSSNNVASNAAELVLQQVVFTGSVGFFYVLCASGQVNLIGACTGTNPVNPAGMFTVSGGKIAMGIATVPVTTGSLTITGSPTWSSAGLQIGGAGQFNVNPGCTFSGSASGSHYVITGGAYVNLGGQTVPGSTAGTGGTTTGGGFLTP